MLAINIILIILLVSVIVWRERRGQLSKVIFPAIFLKVVAGIGFASIYYFYYGEGDTFIYLNESGNFGRYVINNPEFIWFTPEHSADVSGCTLAVTDEPRVWFFARFTAPLTIFTHYNFWLNTIWFSLIVFLISLSALKRFANRYPTLTMSLVIVIFFWPSFLFWTSGYQREGIATSLLFWLLSVVFGRSKTNPVLEGFLVVISLYFLWELKYYYCALFVAVSVGYAIANFVQRKFKLEGAWSLITVFTGTMIFGAFIGSLVHPNLNISEIHHSIAENHANMILLDEHALLITFDRLSDHWLYLLLYAPKALLSSLLRPFIWEADSLVQLVVSIENIFVMLLLVFGATGWLKFGRSGITLPFIALVIFAVSLLVVLTFSSPNVGSLARYKVSCLPLLLVIGLQGVRLWFPQFFYALDNFFGVNKKHINY